MIDYIDFGSKTESDDDLYTYYNKVKEYILLRTKDQIAKQVLMEGPRIKGKVDCVLERSKAFSLKALGQVDSTGQRSIFGQLWQQLKGKTDRFKKRPRKIKFPFSVKFKGEGGIDAGGLFRETLDQLCDELQSSCLPLLVPTPNNKTAFGEFREKWTVNPSATQELNFEMYTFLGNLIGMSFRLGHLLPLNLSSVFWKRLAGEKVDRADLRGVDAYCVQCLDDIVNIDKKGVDSKSFSQVIDDCFVTRLSDGSEVELIKNGRNVKMTFENRTEYAGLVETARLEEGQAQIKAVVAGVFSVVPQSVIRLYTWRELEYKVCGKPSFSVDALKKITRYSVFDSSPRCRRDAANAMGLSSISGRRWRSSQTRRDRCICGSSGGGRGCPRIPTNTCTRSISSVAPILISLCPLLIHGMRRCVNICAI